MARDNELKKELLAAYRDISGSKTTAHYSLAEINLENDKEIHEKAADELIALLKTHGYEPPKRTLEIGAGMGDMAIALSRSIPKVSAIEPEEKYYKICLLKKRYYNAKNVSFNNAPTESIPYGDRKFDLVLSKTVLEHVSDLEKAVGEISRVTEKGGIVYTEAPNYFWIWEGHYRLFMLPLMPKPLFKLYARFMGKDPSFIDGINYITPTRVQLLLKKHGFVSENVYLSKLREILINGDYTLISNYNRGAFSTALKILRLLRLNSIVFWLFERMDFYPTIQLISRKE